MMTDGRLAEHSVLVTGAGSGIGSGIARKMAEEGAAVGINYRSHQEPADKLAAEIRAWGGKTVVIGADVSKELDVHRLFEEPVSAFGRMDVLAANTGPQKDAALAKMTLDDWCTVTDNLNGQFLRCRDAVPLSRKQAKADRPARSAGNIVCMISVHELIPRVGHLNYVASKGGIQMMVRTLAQEGASDTIRVNAVAPGCYSNPDQSGGPGNQRGNGVAAQADPIGRILRSPAFATRFSKELTAFEGADS